MTDTRNQAWAPGDHLTHRFNPDLGVGRVSAIDGRILVVEFPQAGSTLRLAAGSDALVPVNVNAGAPGPERTLLDRLAAGELDDAGDFQIRLDVLNLWRVREANGLGSFFGGRVRLFPHQLHVADRATASDPVRWLLADEVGLGKTIEACLILNHLVHTRRIERCLVVAPAALTVQWLGELWRKYHQVFTLLDQRRLADVERDFGAGFNPFELHRRAVIALETLTADPQLTAQAVAAGIDLLVVDEAQHLRRPAGHPGEPSWRAVAPIAALGRHVLLLSATPLEDDAHGFFRLLQLLRPEEFPEDTGFDARLAAGTPLPPCTSSTRRVDIGGLPPRAGVPIVIDDAPGWPLREAVEASVRATAASNVVTRQKKGDRIRRALASGAALAGVLGPDERALREQAQAMDAADPRVEWLLAQAPRWRDARDKTLVFVAHRETLEMLRTALSHRVQLATGAFHEELPPSRRDLEVARFRDAGGPSLLVSTEAGGEGRNFEFCQRLVLFDLPWKPSVVEQRIGRLDRIGRRLPVEIVYFRPPRGIGADAVRLFEALGLFREPLAGVEPELVQVEGTLEAVADDPAASLADDTCQVIVSGVGAARTRIREAAFQQLHRDPYQPGMAAGILARLPADLDALNQDVVVAACTRLGFAVEHTRGRRIFAIELGSGALVDSLPGVRSGSAYVGSFDREEAVEDETIDFFASGHALVEGVLAHFEDGLFGRVTRVELQAGREPGEGLAAIYKDGPDFEVIALDAKGRARPEWAAALRERPRRIRRADDEPSNRAKWTAMVRRLGTRLDPARTPHALAALVVRP
jgi:ATP-dependent helicase HepA